MHNAGMPGRIRNAGQPGRMPGRMHDHDAGGHGPGYQSAGLLESVYGQLQAAQHSDRRNHFDFCAMQQLFRGLFGLSHFRVSGGHGGRPYEVEAEEPANPNPWPQFGPLGEVLLAHPVVGPRLQEAAVASQSFGRGLAAADRLLDAAGGPRVGLAPRGGSRVGARAEGGASGFGGSAQDAGFSSEEEEGEQEAGAGELASADEGAVAGGSAGPIPDFRAGGGQQRSPEAMQQRNARKKARRRERAAASSTCSSMRLRR